MIDETNHFDVVIAGAGPAGSSLAIRLAKQGLRVALVEQKRFPDINSAANLSRPSACRISKSSVFSTN
ncbi:MAG: FAD-binding protein [Acidobacteria bacterium]|nr:FAD-binding protein [Acidobacteriota bacterium]